LHLNNIEVLRGVKGGTMKEQNENIKRLFYNIYNSRH